MNSKLGHEQPMISELHITNFRGIREFHMKNAGRVNVIAGPNGTGKTALLEGLFFASGGSPELLVRTRGWRGNNIDDSQSHTDPRSLASTIWAYTFRDEETPKCVFELRDTDGRHRKIEVIADWPDSYLEFDGSSAPTQESGLKFLYYSNGQLVDTFEPEIADGRVKIGNPHNFRTTNFLPARVGLSEPESAKLFSKLRVDGRLESFKAAFLSEFEMLKDIDIEAPSGNLAIWGTMKNGRKLPLSMISGGVNQLAGILVRISANPNSLIIIDEIENGFYHTHFEAIWRCIFDLAGQAGCQIFASTHSLECLDGLSRALSENANDVRFARTYLGQDQEIGYEFMDGEVLFSALEIGEVR